MFANLYVAVVASPVALMSGPWCVEFAGSWKYLSRPMAATLPEGGDSGSSKCCLSACCESCL